MYNICTSICTRVMQALTGGQADHMIDRVKYCTLRWWIAQVTQQELSAKKNVTNSSNLRLEADYCTKCTSILSAL